MKERLERVRGLESLVRLTNRNDEPFVGFVCAVSEQWVMLANVSNEVTLDGYSALRLDRVVNFEDTDDYRYAAFHVEALRLRGQLPLPLPPPVDLTSTESLIASASTLAPLLTIHPELYPDSCFIGRKPRFERGALYLEQIDPGAEWLLDDHEGFSIESIERVDFGGLYEDALWIVAEARSNV